VYDTLKLNGVSTYAIRLRLFLFPFRDKARAWLHSLPPGCIMTWDDLTKIFLTKFLPPSKTASLRNQITTIFQKEDEMLHEARERFEDLLQLCPHHGLQRWMIVQTFYNGVAQPLRSTIIVVGWGTFMNKTEDELHNLIEEMTLDNF